MIHPARTMPFDTLTEGLNAAIAQGLVYRNDDRKTGLSVYTYTKKTIYDQVWTPITRLARGLVVDHNAGTVIATPFVKFYNLGEPGAASPHGSFTLEEKVDGSMMTLFRWNGSGHIANRKRMTTYQSIQARALMRPENWRGLDTGITLIAEFVSPDTRVIVRYPRAELVLLAGYDANGREITRGDLHALGRDMGLRLAKTYPVPDLAAAIALTKSLSRDAEGFVLRFEDGTRLKLKGHEYNRLHALVADCRPTAIWEMLRDGIDPDTMRRDLPEELWGDFDAILKILRNDIDQAIAVAHEAADRVAHLSNAEIAHRSDSVPPELRALVYDIRRNGEVSPRAREALMRRLRPVADQLPNYKPSWDYTRIVNEAEG